MLINYKRPTPGRLVDPEAFVSLYKHRATCEATYRAKEIQDAWFRLERGEPDRTWVYMSMIGAIYEAGRLQGIREERRKKRT